MRQNNWKTYYSTLIPLLSYLFDYQIKMALYLKKWYRCVTNYINLNLLLLEASSAVVKHVAPLVQKLHNSKFIWLMPWMKLYIKTSKVIQASYRRDFSLSQNNFDGLFINHIHGINSKYVNFDARLRRCIYYSDDSELPNAALSFSQVGLSVCVFGSHVKS